MKFKFLSLVICSTLITTSVLAEEVCMKKQFDKLELFNAKFEYLGHVEYEPLILLNNKPVQFKRNQLYKINGVYFSTKDDYDGLCLSTQALSFTKIDSIPELIEENFTLAHKMVDYIIKYKGKLYNSYSFNAIIVNGEQLVLDTKLGKYIKYNDWIEKQPYISL